MEKSLNEILPGYDEYQLEQILKELAEKKHLQEKSKDKSKGPIFKDKDGNII